MEQRKYIIFSTGGRCQWLMKRWSRFSPSKKLSPYQYPRVRGFSTRLSVYRLSGGSPVTSGRATRTFDAGAVRSWFLGPRGPLVEPSISPPVPSRPPVRANFSWVHRWAETQPSGLRNPSKRIFSESPWCQISKFGQIYKYKYKDRDKYKYKDK